MRGATDTFDAFCETYNVSPSERERLVWHLAMFRAQQTVRRLLPAQSNTLGRSP